MTPRREFLSHLGQLSAAGLLGSAACATVTPVQPKKTDALGGLLPTRMLGRTGEQVTMLGLGGWHVGKGDERTAQALIESALEGGVRFFDSAWVYQDGESERRYGKYLVPKYRDKIFLMTKSGAKDAATARKQLDESLQRMGTDHVDLWQVHSVNNPEDVDRRVDQGVLEVFLEAKAKGKARHIGFTGHRMPAAHLRMLEKSDAFVTCQMPVNVVDPGYQSFVENVAPELVKRNIGLLAMKTLSNAGFFGGKDAEHGSGPKVIPEAVSMEQAMRFVWSLPVAVLITGPNDVAQLKEKMDLARAFQPFDDQARKDLVAHAVGFAEKQNEFYRQVEYYKFW